MSAAAQPETIAAHGHVTEPNAGVPSDPSRARQPPAVTPRPSTRSRHALPVTGRPYELRRGDLVQIRHTIQHPDHGQLRNGTAAQITDIDPVAAALKLQLADDTQLILTEPQIADADLRLAYVQHPFPAQGQTTDTTHLIVAAHATREGTYVGLTRAREITEIHVGSAPGLTPDDDRLQRLADDVSRTEPDAPSIRLALASGPELAPSARFDTTAPDRLRVPGRRDHTPLAIADERRPAAPGDTERRSRAAAGPDAELAVEPEARRTRDRDPINEPAEKDPTHRRWPRIREGEPPTPTPEADRDRDQSVGFEP